MSKKKVAQPQNKPTNPKKQNDTRPITDNQTPAEQNHNELINNINNNKNMEDVNMLNKIVENCVIATKNNDMNKISELTTQIKSLSIDELKEFKKLIIDKCDELNNDGEYDLSGEVSNITELINAILNSQKVQNNNKNMGDNTMLNNNIITATIICKDETMAQLLEKEILSKLAVNKESGEKYYEIKENIITIKSSLIPEDQGKILTYALVHRTNSNYKDSYDFKIEGKLPRSKFSEIEHFFAYSKERVTSLNRQLVGYTRVILDFSNGGAFCKEFIVINLDQNQKDRLQDSIDKYEDASAVVQIVNEKLETVSVWSSAFADNMDKIATPLAATTGNVIKGLGVAGHTAYKELQKAGKQLWLDILEETYVKEETKNAIDELDALIKAKTIERKIEKKQKRIAKREERRAIRNNGNDMSSIQNDYSKYMM